MKRPSSLLPLLALGLVHALPGCGPGEARCQADDQCPALATCDLGRCTFHGAPADAGAPDAGLEDGGSPDAGPGDGGELDGGGSDGGAGPGCTIVDDGRITSAESPLAFDLALKYVEADPAQAFPVDLVGRDESGTTVWDFSGGYPSDHPVSIGAAELAGFWFADDFPGPFTGTVLVLPLEGDAGNYGVYERTDDGLRLHGVASAAPDETSIQYDPPVEILRYPLEVGASWSSTTSALGTFEGIFFSSTDTWDQTVDAAGAVETPAGRFQVLRVRTKLEVRIPILVWPFSLPYRYVRYTFVTPCLGVAAFVASVEDEPEDLFTEAQELRRLGL